MIFDDRELRCVACGLLLHDGPCRWCASLVESARAAAGAAVPAAQPAPPRLWCPACWSLGRWCAFHRDLLRLAPQRLTPDVG